MEVEFLSTCGAAQEKQSAATLPSSNPNALPLYFVWGFWPLAKTGAIPRTGFQVPPCTVRCTVRTMPSTYTLRVFREKVGLRPWT